MDPLAETFNIGQDQFLAFSQKIWESQLIVHKSLFCCYLFFSQIRRRHFCSRLIHTLDKEVNYFMRWHTNIFNPLVELLFREGLFAKIKPLSKHCFSFKKFQNIWGTTQEYFFNQHCDIAEGRTTGDRGQPKCRMCVLRMLPKVCPISSC